MVVKETFIIGSSVFFSEYPDYYLKDNDLLKIVEGFPETTKRNTLNINAEGNDVYYYRDMDKLDFINDALESNKPMKIGQFLVPEFVNYLGLTIKDLETLRPVLDTVDEKHVYQKIVFESYIKNNGFYLTKKQRDEAYAEYKRERPDIYGDV